MATCLCAVLRVWFTGIDATWHSSCKAILKIVCVCFSPHFTVSSEDTDRKYEEREKDMTKVPRWTVMWHSATRASPYSHIHVLFLWQRANLHVLSFICDRCRYSKYISILRLISLKNKLSFFAIQEKNLHWVECMWERRAVGRQHKAVSVRPTYIHY